jgi:hypothetical protein
MGVYVFRGRRGGDTNFVEYRIVQPPSGNPVIRVRELAANQSVDVAVLAEDLDGNKSALTAYSNITTASFSTTPGTPTGLAAVDTPGGVRLTWAEVAIPDLDYYEIHESASTGFSISGTGAVGNGTCIAHARGATHDRRFPAGTTYPLTRYYRVVAVRTSTTRGSASTQASATINAAADSDLQPGSVSEFAFSVSDGTDTNIPTTMALTNISYNTTFVSGEMWEFDVTLIIYYYGTDVGNIQVDFMIGHSGGTGTMIGPEYIYTNIPAGFVLFLRARAVSTTLSGALNSIGPYVKASTANKVRVVDAYMTIVKRKK